MCARTLPLPHRQEREKIVDTFHGHGVRLLLMSTRTGGVGLNLACASRVILYDAEWNPAHDAQVFVPVPPPPPLPPGRRRRRRRRWATAAFTSPSCARAAAPPAV